MSLLVSVSTTAKADLLLPPVVWSESLPALTQPWRPHHHLQHRLKIGESLSLLATRSSRTWYLSSGKDAKENTTIVALASDPLLEANKQPKQNKTKQM